MTIPAPRHSTGLLPGYHSPQLEVVVRLNTNEAPEPPPRAYLEALAAELLAASFHRYPDRQATALRAALAEHHKVTPEEVFCANGSNEVLQSLLLAYGGPGRSAAVFEPTYALHSHIAHLTGTELVVGDRDEQFLIAPAELDRLLAAGRRGEDGSPSPAITFLCSPNNPTGRLEPFETVERALAVAPGLVVVDEAYGQFAPRSVLELRQAYDQLVVVRTFSKTWSLAGLRLGYAIADPQVVAAMERVTLPYHLDVLKQTAGRLALRFDAEMRERVSRLVAERRRLTTGLELLGCAVVPSDANFLLFAPPGDPARIWRGLVEASVLVRDVSSWPRLAPYLRVTVGTLAEDDAFLFALGALLTEE